MIRTQVSFDADTYELAKQEAARLGISFAELCRRAVARDLSSRAQKGAWMRYAGLLSSGDPRASQSVDQVVYDRPRP